VKAVGGVASKVGQAVAGKPDENEEKGSLKKWKHKKEGVEQDEASPEAKANKAKRRASELGQQLAHNKPRLSAALKPAPKSFVKWQSKSATA